jgi:hypothetical protein
VAARERLVAFGHRLLEEIELQGDLLRAAETWTPGERLAHSVYAAHRAHVAALLRELPCAGDAEYVADVLLAALAAEVVLYQRRVLGMPLARLKDGWLALLDGLVR